MEVPLDDDITREAMPVENQEFGSIRPGRSPFQRMHFQSGVPMGISVVSFLRALSDSLDLGDPIMPFSFLGGSPAHQGHKK